ncbi:MAG: hypothetical protein Q7R32_08340 [Dehalococcoidia bacterium]|nr:hypothetical protein [Dehalococcoidia bacterium]
MTSIVSGELRFEGRLFAAGFGQRLGAAVEGFAEGGQESSYKALTKGGV